MSFHIFITDNLFEEIKNRQFGRCGIIHHPFKRLDHYRKLEVVKHLENIIASATHLSASCFLMRSESEYSLSGTL